MGDIHFTREHGDVLIARRSTGERIEVGLILAGDEHLFRLLYRVFELGRKDKAREIQMALQP